MSVMPDTIVSIDLGPANCINLSFFLCKYYNGSTVYSAYLGVMQIWHLTCLLWQYPWCTVVEREFLFFSEHECRASRSSLQSYQRQEIDYFVS